MKPEKNAWIKEFPGAITVCDPEGIILEMNDKAAKSHEKDGGYALIGKNLYDCHPDPARGKLRAPPGGTQGERLHHREKRRQEAGLPVPLDHKRQVRRICRACGRDPV